MSNILNYTPGQIVTFYQEVKDSEGQRTNDGYIPVVSRIILPGFVLASGYPVNMNYISTGLYYFQYAIPQGAGALGTYFVDIAYMDPDTQLIVSASRQIIVTAPFGNYGVSIGNGTGGGGFAPDGTAGGDLFGYYPNPTVIGIQGNAFSNGSPTQGQFVVALGPAEYGPTNITGDIVASGVTPGLLTVAGLQGNPISSIAPTLDQVLGWNGSAWTATGLPAFPTSLPPDGPAGGDLSGTYPNPTVSALQGFAVSSSTPNDGYVLTWDINNSYWTPAITNKYKVALFGEQLILGDSFVLKDPNDDEFNIFNCGNECDYNQYYSISIRVIATASNRAVGPYTQVFEVTATLIDGYAVIVGSPQTIISTPDPNSTGWSISVTTDGETNILHVTVHPGADATSRINATADVNWVEVSGFKQ